MYKLKLKKKIVWDGKSFNRRARRELLRWRFGAKDRRER